jgi:hypothetical protein
MHEGRGGVAARQAPAPGARPGLAACLLASALGACGCAGGGSGRTLPAGARPIGQSREATRALTVDALGGFLGAGYLFVEEKQTATDIERTEHIVQERVGASAEGSLYSRDFFRYELSGVYGPTQDWADDQDGSEYDDGELIEGVAGIDLFPTRFHPTRFYATRTEEILPRVFFSRVETTTVTAGGNQDFNFENWGLHFNAEHREHDQKVFATENEPFVDLVEDNVGASADYRISQFQTISGSYQFVDVDQEEAQNSFESHNFLGTHFVTFGGERRHDLRSRFEGTSQDGSLDQELLRWTEGFTSRITDDLTGDINLLVERNDTNLLKLEQIRADAGIRRQFYESLATSLRAYGGVSETDDESTTDTIGGSGTLNYRKKTPAGVFRLDYSSIFERRVIENDAGGAIDEPHTFPAVAPEEIRLTRAFVELSSIDVTDPTGLIFYRLGIDYSVAQDSSGFTTITRIFTGLIPVGGSVLIDYAFRSGADFTQDTVTQRVRTEHEFHGGWTPYFAFAWQDQHISDVDGPDQIEPIRERSLIGGLEWRRDWGVIGGEYENRESTVLPFDAIRLHARSTLRVREVHSLTGSATQSWLFYHDTDSDVASSQVTALWRSNLGEDSYFYVDGALRYDDDSRVGDSFGFYASSGVEYRWRKFLFSVQVTHRETRGVSSDFYSDEAGVRIVREFGSPTRPLASSIQRFLRQ